MQGIGTGSTNLSEITTFLFDLDGVLWRGNTAIEGAVAAVKEMKQAGKRCLFCTNNSSRTTASYVEKLSDMGLSVTESDVLTSSWVTALYLSGHFTGPFLAYVIGEEGIHSALQKIGARIVPDSDLDSIESVDCVVVGMDRGFNYEKLHHAQRLIGNGALFIATNRDASYPVEDGVKPGAGSIVAAVEAASATTPVTVGKPRPVMVDLAIQELNIDPSEVAFVGDRLDTDIVCARRAGTTAICVLTGVTTEEKALRARGELRPHYIYATLTDLCQEVLAPSPAVTSAPAENAVEPEPTTESEATSTPEEGAFTLPTELSAEEDEPTAEVTSAPAEIAAEPEPGAEATPSPEKSAFSLPTELSAEEDKPAAEATSAPAKIAAKPEPGAEATPSPEESAFSLPSELSAEEDEPAAEIATSPAGDDDSPETSLSDDIDQLFEESKEQSDANSSEDETTFDLGAAINVEDESEPELPASQKPASRNQEAESSEDVFDLDTAMSSTASEGGKPPAQNSDADAKKEKADEGDFDWKLD